jgi:hypothetical protein
MIAAYTAHEGNTLYFWRDTWNAWMLQWKFPQLYSFALNKNISLKAFRDRDLESFLETSIIRSFCLDDRASGPPK